MPLHASLLSIACPRKRSSEASRWARRVAAIEEA